MKESYQHTSSPKDNKRGCLCKNGKYSKRCCKGKLENQGVGRLENQSTSSVSNNQNVRVNNRVSTDYNL